MTFVPSPWICPCTSALALSPMETIVVTAAMPITMPSTVRPARILFLARARKAMRTVSRRFIGVPPRSRDPGRVPGLAWFRSMHCVRAPERRRSYHRPAGAGGPEAAG